MLDVGSSRSEARQAVRALCPQPLLNWREARFYGRYGEVELHLLEFLCRPDADALDIGANDGSYVHYMRRHARHVVAFEPMPILVEALRHKFPRGVTVQPIALSDHKGSIELRMPVVDGVVVTGCATVSDNASAAYPAYQGVDVPMERLDDVYSGTCGFIKVDVEGHQQAVLEGAVETIRRCQPRMLVEVEDRLSPGGLAPARAFFDRLGYRGLFVHQGQLKPIDQFSVATMQDPADLPDLTASLTERQRFGRYIYNFIFLPPGEPELTESRISLRLRELAP
jgi:FkbM family methyltransferase